MSLYHTLNIVKKTYKRINQKGLSICMYAETIVNYPLLGIHLCAIHFKQDISNLLWNNSLNTSQIKFIWGLMSLFGLE